MDASYSLEMSTRSQEDHHAIDGSHRVAAAASELPIEAVLAMVVEGLGLLAVYRAQRAQGVGESEALADARRPNRPLLQHYRGLIQSFVSSHDMTSEQSNEELGTTIAASVKGIEWRMNEAFANVGVPTEPSGSGDATHEATRAMHSNAPSPSGDGHHHRYYAILAKVREAFDVVDDADTRGDESSVVASRLFGNTTTRGKMFAKVGGSACVPPPGMEEALFCEFVAPALTLSTDTRVNKRFVARTNVTQSHYITWESFSNFFVRLHGDITEETSHVQFVAPTSSVQHNASIRKLLFTRARTAGGTGSGRTHMEPSVNPAMDRYCLSGGYDGTVHMWDTAYYDHVVRLHYIPNANKAKRWINDMSYTCGGRLTIAQSRGLVYTYSVLNPMKPYLHRVFRSNTLLSEDEESLVRADIERVRLQQGKTRFTAADCPAAEFCVMSSPAPGDVTTVHGPTRLSKFSTAGHMEPLLVGLDSGLVHLYNIFKPIEFKAQIAPMQTFAAFEKADVYQVMDHPLDVSFLCAGRSARGVSSIQIVDYEKCEASLVLQPHHSCVGSGSVTPSLTRFDFDESMGLIVATGATRSATIFSTSFPDPVTILADHSAPVVGGVVNASQYQIYTFSEDHTFHLFDIRMFRKVQTFCDASSTAHDVSAASGSQFGCGAFDGTRGVPVAASSTPVALVIQQQQSVGAAVGAAGGDALSVQHKLQPDRLTPSGLGTDLRRVIYCAAFESLIAAEGDALVMRSGAGEAQDETVVRLSDAVIDVALDQGQRRTAALVQGRGVQLLSTMGGNRVAKWNCSGIDAMDEGTCICFAQHPSKHLVVVVGTFHGTVAVYHVEDDGAEIFQTERLGSAVLCVCAASHDKQRVLVGTVDGDVLMLNLENQSLIKVLDFETAHSSFKGTLELGGAKEKDAQTAGEVKKGSADSLIAFRNRAYASMDKGVEIIREAFEPAQSFILYGSGAMFLVRVSHSEIIPLLQFPSVHSHTSASALGVNLHSSASMVAVGDFNGHVTLFQVKKVSKIASHAGGGGISGGGGRPLKNTSQVLNNGRQVSSDDGSRRRSSGANVGGGGASFDDYEVALQRQISLSTTSLVSDILFVSDVRMVVSLCEQLQIFILNVDGTLLSVLSHATAAARVPVPSELPSLLQVSLPRDTHPFFRMVPAVSLSSNASSTMQLDMQTALGSNGGVDEVSFRPQFCGVLQQRADDRRVSLGSVSQALSTSNYETGKSKHATKPTFHMPKATQSRISQNASTPRGLSSNVYPSSPRDVIAPIRLGCNDFNNPCSEQPAPSTRPSSARMQHDGASERLYPQPPPATSRPPSAKNSTVPRGTSANPPPLIQYCNLTANPLIITSDVSRLQPPTYSARQARPPSAPVFSFQRKTAEMSSKTDKMLQDAVDNATNISSRIVSNIRQRRVVGSTSGGRTGDGRVFLTLEQQPIPAELLRAVAQGTNTTKGKKK